MTRNHAFRPHFGRGMLRHTHQARAPLSRPRGEPVVSLLSDDENEDEDDEDSGTEFGDDIEDVTDGVEQAQISDEEDDGGSRSRTPADDLVDLTADDDDESLEEAHFQRDVSSASAEIIGAGIPRSHQHLPYASTESDVRIRPGDTVECDGGPDIIAFLRIIFITSDRSGDIYVHGILLKRHRDVDRKISFSKDYQGLLHSLLPTSKNELCAMIRIRHGSSVTSLDSTLEVRHIREVGRVRRLTFTNKPREDLRGRTRGEFFTAAQWKEAEQMGDLFCRWKYIEEVDTVKKKVVAFQIRRIEQHESELGAGIAKEREYELFRGTPSRTPASSPPVKKRRRDAEVISIDSDDNDSPNDFERRVKPFSKRRNTIQKTKTVRHATKLTEVRRADNGMEERRTYKTVEEVTSVRSRRRQKTFTYSDICAGAGGTAAGAKKAGLKLHQLIDLCSDPCKSMKLNFPEATVLKMDVSDFATSAATLSDIVDVMHISYPCQGHSLRNHQTNPEQDARNISVAYGTFGLILRNRKPRIITLEQVRGIMQRSDGQHLRAQISDLVEAGYSVRWSLLNLAEYENVQARARVIVIASCPGQELPSFPAKTHGPGLKPLVTIRDILAQVPQHPPSIMSHAVKRNFPAYNPDVPLRGCITSGGVTQKSGGYHPNGRRDFNLQEMAQMQGFSADHRFYGNITSIRRQIGNAVPPVFAKKLFKSIIPALEETDKKMEAWNKVIEL